MMEDHLSTAQEIESLMLWKISPKWIRQSSFGRIIDCHGMCLSATGRFFEQLVAGTMATFCWVARRCKGDLSCSESRMFYSCVQTPVTVYWIGLRPSVPSWSEKQWVAQKCIVIHKKATCVCLRLPFAASCWEAQERKGFSVTQTWPHLPTHQLYAAWITGICVWQNSYTPFTLALLIRSETGFAPMRAFTLHQLIRISDLNRIKLNHLLEVVSHRFSVLRVLIASVDATRTRTKAEQIWPNQCQMLHSYLRCRVPGVFTLQRKCSVVNTILIL